MYDVVFARLTKRTQKCDHVFGDMWMQAFCVTNSSSMHRYIIKCKPENNGFLLKIWSWITVPFPTNQARDIALRKTEKPHISSSGGIQ